MQKEERASRDDSVPFAREMARTPPESSKIPLKNAFAILPLGRNRRIKSEKTAKKITEVQIVSILAAAPRIASEKLSENVRVSRFSLYCGA